MGIGTITVPPLGPYQTINLVQNITLPAVEPLSIANYTNFGLTMTQDANYLTNDLYPNQPAQGVGYDQTPITITTSSTSTATAGPLPDLAASSDHRADRHDPMGPVVPGLHGRPEPRPGRRRTVPGLLPDDRPGRLDQRRDLPRPDHGLRPRRRGSQAINQTLTLPTRLPSGVTLNSVGYARIAVIVDPRELHQ